MSYKYDVGIVLKQENFEELNNKIMTYGFEDEELIAWNNKKVNKIVGGFVVIQWHYVKWDDATDELVILIEEYIKMLHMNSISNRYIKIGEFKEDITDLKTYNPASITEIALINSALYPSIELKMGFQPID